MSQMPAVPSQPESLLGGVKQPDTVAVPRDEIRKVSNILQSGARLLRRLEQDGDAVTQAAGLKVAINAQSLPYCDGAKVEWVDGSEGTGFLVRNPSMGGTCGCGG